MSGISQILREQLGEEASKVPTRTMPGFVLRFMSLFDPSLRSMTPRLGRRHRHTVAKAQKVLGWRTRPAAVTLVDCARTLISARA